MGEVQRLEDPGGPPAIGLHCSQALLVFLDELQEEMQEFSEAFQWILVASELRSKT